MGSKRSIFEKLLTEEEVWTQLLLPVLHWDPSQGSLIMVHTHHHMTRMNSSTPSLIMLITTTASIQDTSRVNIIPPVSLELKKLLIQEASEN